MEITEEQSSRIKGSLPVQRGNVSLTNLQVMNAILYVAEQGCEWRGLPKRFGASKTRRRPGSDPPKAFTHNACAVPTACRILYSWGTGLQRRSLQLGDGDNPAHVAGGHSSCSS